MARGYFHRGESEQYTFYRTPKVLFTEPEYEELTALAKILYGILLDRESLSDKSGWFDDRGRIFVYMTNRSICRLLRISDKTATKILVELEEIDLIQRVRQGQGKPSRIYVKNFLDTEHVRRLTSNGSDSELGESADLGSEVLRCNDTETIHTECKETHLITSTDAKREDKRLQYRQYFMERLEIDTMKHRYPYDREVIDEIMELILDTVCSTRETIGIAGEQRPIDIVKSRFMQLTAAHLEYVLHSMSETTSLIKNPKAYMLATLYNSSLTMDSYYRSLARHDMT